MLSGSAAPKRYVAYTAAFSRQATVRQLYEFLGSRLRLRPEDTRLWHVRDEVRAGVLRPTATAVRVTTGLCGVPPPEHFSVRRSAFYTSLVGWLLCSVKLTPRVLINFEHSGRSGK